MSELDPRADQLSIYLDRIASGESVDSVLADVTDQDLAELVTLAADTAEVAPTKAPPAFRGRLQVLLQSELEAQGNARRPQAGLVRLWLGRAVAAVLALAMLMSTAVVASADSIPGDHLYGLKRTVEDARLAVAFDPAHRVQLRVSLVGVRLAEIEQMIDRGVPLDAGVVEELIAAQQAAEAEAEASGDTALVEHAEEQGSELGRELERMVDRVDADTQAMVRDAAQALEGHEEREGRPFVPASSATSAATVAATDIATAEPSAAPPTATSPTEPVAPTESEPEGIAPPLATVPEIASPPPAEPTSPAPTSPPATSRPPDPATSEPTLVASTDVPNTAEPSAEASPLPTLKREDERNQTRTAEAQPSPTRTPRRRPQNGNTVPTPVPPTPPSSPQPAPGDVRDPGPPVPPAPPAGPRDRSGRPAPKRGARMSEFLEPLPTPPPPTARISRS